MVTKYCTYYHFNQEFINFENLKLRKKSEKIKKELKLQQENHRGWNGKLCWCWLSPETTEKDVFGRALLCMVPWEWGRSRIHHHVRRQTWRFGNELNFWFGLAFFPEKICLKFVIPGVIYTNLGEGIHKDCGLFEVNPQWLNGWCDYHLQFEQRCWQISTEDCLLIYLASLCQHVTFESME